MLKFSPRKPRSPWSQSNKVRVIKLIEKNLMTPAGQQKIDRAKKNGSWELLTASDHHTGKHTLPSELEMPCSGTEKAGTISSPGGRISQQFPFWKNGAKLLKPGRKDQANRKNASGQKNPATRLNGGNP